MPETSTASKARVLEAQSDDAPVDLWALEASPNNTKNFLTQQCPILSQSDNDNSNNNNLTTTTRIPRRLASSFFRDDLMDIDTETTPKTAMETGETQGPTSAANTTKEPDRAFATPSEEEAFGKRHKCVNPRCATHADYIPPHMIPGKTWPMIIKHPRLRESAGEIQRWIDIDGNDVTDTLPQTEELRKAIPVDTGRCACAQHDTLTKAFEDAVRACDFIRRIYPVLQGLADAQAVKYGPKGWAHDLITDVLIDGADTKLSARTYSRRWRWCLACLLRPRRKNRHLRWRRVWVVGGFVNDDWPWLPMWSSMVPPHGMITSARTADMSSDRAWRRALGEMTTFYDSKDVMGSKDNADGVFITAKKVNNEKWLQNGGRKANALLIKYGVHLPIVKEKRPYRKAPYGNYKELHQDPEINAAFQRGYRQMQEWGMVDETGTGPHFDTIPMFYVIQRKDDGSFKERGIQDAKASGLNAIMAKQVCILIGIDDIHSELKSGDFIWTRDLSNAFWHWAYNCRFALLLGIVNPWNMEALLRAMLMGLINSPGVEQFFAEDLCDMLVKRGARRAKPYIDDFTGSDAPLRKAILDMEQFDALCIELERIENSEKKKKGPLQVDMVSLGVLADTTAYDGDGRGYVSEERLDRFIYDRVGCTVQVLIDLVERHGVSHIPMGIEAKVGGRLGSIAKFIWTGVAHQRPLYEGWKQFASANADDDDNDNTAPQVETVFDDDELEAPPANWESTAPDIIARQLRAIEFEESRRGEFDREHPLLQYWHDEFKLKAVKCYNAKFPCEVTKRKLQCWKWWIANARERNGVPLGLRRPEGFRGRLRADLIDIDNDYIDIHSRTRSGFHVITTDAATHGDKEPEPGGGAFYNASERLRVVFDEKTMQDNGIFGLEGGTELIAFRRYAPLVAANEVVFRGDNTGGLAAINKGMCRNTEFEDRVIIPMYEVSWQHKMPFCCIWCCTHCMWLADGISRGTIKSTSCDHMFKPDEFEKIVAIVGSRPTLDGFSNPGGDNAHCPRWCSLKDNFFQKDLRGFHVWVNADFKVIQEALIWWLKAKAAAPDCTSATFLVPMYKTRPWERLMMTHFTMVKEYEAGERLFLTTPATIRATREEGLDVHPRERRCLGGTRWKVQVWHCK